MISSIINRIQQIKCGEVPKCYYKTKAGIMPKDWLQNGEFMAKDIFRSVSDKKHDCHYQVLSATQDKGIVPRNEIDINIKYNKSNLSGYKKVNRGDFVISLRSFQGGIEYSSYEGLVSPAYTVLRANVPICEDYYKAYFKMDNFIKRLNNGTYGIRDGKQIGYEDFGNMIIHYPPIEEQKKIAEILTTQDKIIELKERKLAELKKLKKYYLSKMFPKRGTNYPEVRFPGFTDPWEQRMLGEVLKICDEKNGKKFTREDVLAVSDTYGCVNQIAFHGRSFAGEDISNYKIVKTGDIVYTKSPLQAKPYGIIKIVGKETGIVSPLYIVNEAKQGFDPMFIYYLFDTPERTNNYLSLLVNKGAKNTMNISIDEWLSGIITIAPSEKEQKVIAKIFYSLDQIISLHQREIDEEKKLKKSLMQLLLTGIVRV